MAPGDAELTRARYWTTILLGPLLGTLAFTVCLGTVWLPAGTTLDFMLELLPWILPLGYLAGLPSALLAGLVYGRLAARLGGNWTQLIAAIPVGGLTGFIGVYLITFIIGDPAPNYVPFRAFSIVSGAVSLPVCSLIFLWLVQPRLRRRAAERAGGEAV